MKKVYLCLLLIAPAISSGGTDQKHTFERVIEVTPQYVAVPCPPDICFGMPDLRLIGHYFLYKCKGDTYRTWIPGPIQVGVYVKVEDCNRLVISKDRVPVTKHADEFTNNGDK